MGLFHKDKNQDEEEKRVEHFFDHYFQEELRNHGRWYFEKVISENGTIFKQELEATIERLNTELKERVDAQLDASVEKINAHIEEHIKTQLDAQFAEYTKVVKEAQDTALESLNKSAQEVLDQNTQLSSTLKDSIAKQEEALKKSSDENLARLNEMKSSQEAALEQLTNGAKAVEDEYQNLSETLKKRVEEQQTMHINAFKDNMAQVVEHYLLEALGEQYDMKAQLPSIISQLEANKQAIVDDMQL